MTSPNNIENARVWIGECLKLERKDREWTQARLAKFLSVSLKTVRDWEMGHNDGPTAVQLGLLAGAGFDTQYILTAGLNHQGIPPCMYNVEWLEEQPQRDLTFIKGTVLDALNRLAMREIARLEAGEAQ